MMKLTALSMLVLVLLVGVLCPAFILYHDLTAQSTRYVGPGIVIDLFHTHEKIESHTSYPHGNDPSVFTYYTAVPETWSAAILLDGEKVSADVHQSVWYELRIGSEVQLWETSGPIFCHGYSVQAKPKVGDKDRGT